jgi:hypothetical protein
MTTAAERIVKAEQLMEQALVLLDETAGEEQAACHLQTALDALRRTPPMKVGDELDPELLARFGFDSER